MASTSNKPHDYTIRHIRPGGSSIQIDPPLSPALQPGQYTRLLNSTLLDARAVDAGPTTVEGAFNRLLGEAEVDIAGLTREMRASDDPYGVAVLALNRHNGVSVPV